MRHKIFILFWFDRTMDEYVIYGTYVTEHLAEYNLSIANNKGYGGLTIVAQDLEGDIKCLQPGTQFTASKSVTSYESTTPTMLLNRSRKTKNRKNGLHYI